MRIRGLLAGIAVAGATGSALAIAGATKAAYAPGLGEIMALPQMRHAKLWLAGSVANWPLAAYELDELREGFSDASKFHPTHDGVRPVLRSRPPVAGEHTDELLSKTRPKT